MSSSFPVVASDRRPAPRVGPERIGHHGDMRVARYAEQLPPPALALYAACAWVRYGREQDGRHRVLPDGCSDLVWSDGELFVVGRMSRAIEQGSRHAAGVRLRPGAARLLGLPA